MSSSGKDQDWEKVLNKLTAENKKTPSQGKASSLGVVSFLIMNAMSALAFMRLNSTVNSAWENVELFRPGIGYVDAFAVTGVLWFAFLLKVAIRSTFGRTSDSR